jgi:ADP-glucose pyrophosphorylase
VKRSVLAKHVSVGKLAKISGSVLMEGVVVGEKCVGPCPGLLFPLFPLFLFLIARLTCDVCVCVWLSAKLDNCVLAPGVRIGDRCNLKDCEVAAGYEVEPDGKRYSNLGVQ